MSIFKIYKMELYKMSHRKNTWLLFIPCLLGILFAVGVGTGTVKVSGANGNAKLALSCLEFISFCWVFLRELGIVGILFILVAAFSFSGEIEGGQIKLQLLRVGNRGKVLISKLLTITSWIAVSMIAFVIVTGIAYYIFIANSAYGNGILGLTKEIGYTYSGLILSLIGNLVTFVILSAICLLVGQKLNVLATFVCTLVIMFAANYICTIEAISLRKYMIPYISNAFLLNTSIAVKDVVTFIVCSAIYISVIMVAAFTVFIRKDVK